ncbi:MAG: helix-hairpin-helix domain-containing protein [Clostridiales bacterium]|nr:helix-hairpin-helix domain-containing protein [Clostridiales bacterium]
MKFTKKQKWILLVVIALVLISITKISEINLRETKYTLSAESDGIAVEITGDFEKTSSEKIVVHIEGYVLNPGVYELKEGARVIDAIEVAGGLAENASPQKINLAQRIFDEAYIYIPSEQDENFEVSQLSSVMNSSGKVNINRANVERLMSLPGIGESIAERIIAYRKKHGKFNSIEEIKSVSGIGDRKFEEIEEKISVK